MDKQDERDGMSWMMGIWPFENHAIAIGEYPFPSP